MSIRSQIGAGIAWDYGGDTGPHGRITVAALPDMSIEEARFLLERLRRIDDEYRAVEAMARARGDRP